MPPHIKLFTFDSVSYNLFILINIFLGFFSGLFTADQKLKGTSSIFTRQNANGGRSGYECPEERDYYPYWHPTDWIDIAVFANDKSFCQYYQRESFNVKTKRKFWRTKLLCL